MVSTPNRPDGLFNKIEKESFESCIYKKLFLDYTYGFAALVGLKRLQFVITLSMTHELGYDPISIPVGKSL